ncbi:MAG: hypothetical protein U0003_01785 [Vampirovibrionales bacterium]
MRLLLYTHAHRLGHSFALLRRYWVVVYPVFLLQLILELLWTPALAGAWLQWQQGVGGQVWEWRLWAVAVVALMLLAAFTAGWMGMLATLVCPEAVAALMEEDEAQQQGAALRRQLHQKMRQALLQSATELSQHDPLSAGSDVVRSSMVVSPPLWRGFFSAIGAYWGVFVLGWLVFFSVWAALIFWIHVQTVAAGGYPAIFSQVMHWIQHQSTQAEWTTSTGVKRQLMALVQAMPTPEVLRLEAFSRRITQALLWGGLWSVLTLGWPAAAVLAPQWVSPYRRVNAPWVQLPYRVWVAYATSVQRFLVAPFIWMVWALAVYAGWVLLALVSTGIAWLAPLVWLLALLGLTVLALYGMVSCLEDAPKSTTVSAPPALDVFEPTSGGSSPPLPKA